MSVLGRKRSCPSDECSRHPRWQQVFLIGFRHLSNGWGRPLPERFCPKGDGMRIKSCLIVGLCLLAASGTAKTVHPAEIADVGRIVATRDARIFWGDLELIGFVSTLEISDRPSSRIDFITTTAECTSKVANGRLYRVILHRDKGRYRIWEANSDLDVVASACAPVDPRP
jgi:hypothetical protein